MQVEVRLQLAGADRIEQELNELLGQPGYARLRVLVAFARWSGLHLLDAALRAFVDRGEADIIVGIDLGGTTGEALEYLMRLPNTRVRVFRSGNPFIVFHPKAYVLDGPGGWCAII